MLVSKRIRNTTSLRISRRTNERTDTEHTCIHSKNPTNRILIKQSKLIPSIEWATRTTHTEKNIHTMMDNGFSVSLFAGHHQISIHFIRANAVVCCCCFHFAWTAHTHTYKICTLRRTYTWQIDFLPSSIENRARTNTTQTDTGTLSGRHANPFYGIFIAKCFTDRHKGVNKRTKYSTKFSIEWITNKQANK